MESELLSFKQVELMFKLKEHFDTLSIGERQRLEDELSETILEDLTEEELAIIKEECDRLNEENEKRIKAERFIEETERQFNNIIKPSYIPGFD